MAPLNKSEHKAVPHTAFTFPRATDPPAVSQSSGFTNTNSVLPVHFYIDLWEDQEWSFLPPFFSPQVTLWNIFCVPFHFKVAQCGGSPEETNERAQGYGSVCLHASFFLISAAPSSAWAPAGQVMAVPAGASSSDGQRFISPSWWFMARQSKEKLVCMAPGCLS